MNHNLWWSFYKIIHKTKTLFRITAVRNRLNKRRIVKSRDVYASYPKVTKVSISQSSNDACQINHLETIVNETGPASTRFSKFWSLPSFILKTMYLNKGSNFWIDGDFRIDDSWYNARYYSIARPYIYYASDKEFVCKKLRSIYDKTTEKRVSEYACVNGRSCSLANVD